MSNDKWINKNDDAWISSFNGLEYREVWFVVDGFVHKGEGNGKFFYDDGSYPENQVSHFAVREPEVFPEPPKE